MVGEEVNLTRAWQPQASYESDWYLLEGSSIPSKSEANMEVQ